MTQPVRRPIGTRAGMIPVWLLCVALALILVAACSKPATRTPTAKPSNTPTPAIPSNAVVVTHWANGHMMNTALLPRFAEEFNRAGHKTQSGKPIYVRPYLFNSGVLVDELVARVTRGTPLNASLPDPTIVTPAANHWLRQVNPAVGRMVIDPGQAQTLAVTWVGLATYREMAECLGWPEKEIGIADIIALRTNPRGWATCPKAKVEWGQQPLLSFTDPNSSSTARSVLLALYAIAAGKAPEQLSAADVADPSVVRYVKTFQSAVDHYVPDTLILNSKIYLGPRYGHFFFIGESNLVQLYQGKLAVTVGAEARPQPLSRPMVMIYPKEGAITHNHSAAVVQANWVTPEQAEAAQLWIAFLRGDQQQRAFMQEGFRPATGLPLAETISARFGLDPSKPTTVLDPDTMDAGTAATIVQAWDDVKKPGIVTFVVDTSGSMDGTKLEQAKQGLQRALGGMNNNNRVGLVSFDNTSATLVPVGPLASNRSAIASALQALKATGFTALYDAVKDGITLADAAPGDEDAIRGVVVITDGKANRGQAVLHDLVAMMSTSETCIREFRGFENDGDAVDTGGKKIKKSEVIGTRLAVQTRHPIHVFFIGIGDADMEIGRILAEATNSAFQGAPEKDLARVLEQFGKYF